MYPHERSLVKQLAGKPFSLIGVNSDDDLQAIRKIVDRKNLTWRSFQNESSARTISDEWGIQGWPTVFILDANGVIRYRGHEVKDEIIEELLAELGHEVEIIFDDPGEKNRKRRQRKQKESEKSKNAETDAYAIEKKIEGATILATKDVDPAYVKIAANVYQTMTSKKELFDLRAIHEDSQFKIILISEKERFSKLPHYRGQGRMIDRAGGLGGQIGEFYIGVRVGSPHILIHELGHGIYHSGIQFKETGGETNLEKWHDERAKAVYGVAFDEAAEKHGEDLVHEVLLAPPNTFSARLAAAWKNAQARSIWKGTYAGSEPNEYWAEGVAMWFRAYSEIDGDSRDHLRTKDPMLFELCKSIFPDDEWTPKSALDETGADVPFRD